MKVHLEHLVRPWETRCGEPRFRVRFDKQGVDHGYAIEAVELPTWRNMPPSAQCSKCSRSLPTKLHADSETIIAIEVALHGIAGVFT